MGDVNSSRFFLLNPFPPQILPSGNEFCFYNILFEEFKLPRHFVLTKPPDFLKIPLRCGLGFLLGCSAAVSLIVSPGKVIYSHCLNRAKMPNADRSLSITLRSMEYYSVSKKKYKLFELECALGTYLALSRLGRKYKRGGRTIR